MKLQSLNAEEGEGPLSPLIAKGFSRQRMPCVSSGVCAVHGYCSCLYGVKWKPKFTSWLTAAWWLGALGQWQGRAMSPSHALNIHCAASQAGHRPEPTKTESCHPLAEGQMVGGGWGRWTWRGSPATLCWKEQRDLQRVL